MSYQQTKMWIVDKGVEKETKRGHLREAGLCISEGQVIAFPTETVYGLGANAWDNQALARIFAAKGRPDDNPLILHIDEVEKLTSITSNIPLLAEKLISAYWPGPLTLVLPKAKEVSERVTGGLHTVAVRLPDHPVAREIIRQADVPVAAPSANRSGKPSPTTARHVYEDLNGRIDGIVDGGPTGYGLESTVVDATGEIPVILRPGGITAYDIEAVCGSVAIDPALSQQKESDQPKSPGLKYRHYAPEAPVYIIEGTLPFIQEQINKQQYEGKKVALLTVNEHLNEVEASIPLSLGSIVNAVELGASLYAALRTADEKGADIIFAESFSREGVGEALMNRLEKAASGRYIRK
ncbi:L-threonylcarbamoyladenylate synthase [Salsuginibacillus kocurii]|uniref:L-threonylcarbamoyladenylate synthase n=1 Tax=Salsuginibacillus kocurii TaxID=427078 RepID=UPI000373AC9E|nr:L-threonylcarbamoyladenylate synthase [Salsuginibacillus kocurii]